jgi:hypothetical protein
MKIETEFQRLPRLAQDPNGCLFDVADREFVHAISIAERAGLPEPLVGCLAAYAALLEKRGDTQGALEQMKRAVTVTRPDLAAPASRVERAAEETA